jgi:hypothetical protein
MYYNTPVIASDTVKRPKGCITYKFNDIENLKESILNIYKGDLSFSFGSHIDTVEKISMLYNKLN